MSSFKCQQFKTYIDDRGQLTVAEFSQLDIPFTPQRAFWIHNIPENSIRGEHANRNCSELVVAVNGSFRLWLTDGKNEQEFLLNSPGEGVYIPPMVWCKLSHFTANTICLCLADKAYDPSDYIDEYEVFLYEKQNAR